MASSATKMANEPEGAGEERQPDVQLQDVLFSALASSVCYWTTIFLLAIVGAYLIQWWLTHPGPYPAPANDPWGITTPPWLILPLAPIGVVGPTFGQFTGLGGAFGGVSQSANRRIDLQAVFSF